MVGGTSSGHRICGWPNGVTICFLSNSFNDRRRRRAYEAGP